MKRPNHRFPMVLLTLFALMAVPPPAAAQIETAEAGEEQEGIYAIPIGNPTIVWEEPSRDARVLARLDSADVALESVETVTEQDEVFEKVRPRSGSGLSWSVGYVLADHLKVDIERPRQVGGGVYGSMAFSSAEPSLISIEGTPVAQNPFGEGRSPMYSIGLTVQTGKYIPPGDAGLWTRVDIDYSILQSNDGASNIENSTASMLRLGLGGTLIYQVSPSIDLSIAALAGGGPVNNKLTFVNEETLTANALFGTIDALVGMGFGRNAASQPGTFRGLRLRLEGGYRLGTRLGNWSYTSEDKELDGSFEASDADKALSLSGPVVRLVVGL